MKEYYTVKMIAEHFNISRKTVYRTIDKLKSDHSNLLLGKSAKYSWLVHHLLLNKFKPKRVRKVQPSLAVTIDFGINSHAEAISKSMECLFDYLQDEKASIEYSVERKKSDNTQHIHALIESSDSKSVTKKVFDLFRGLSIRIKKVYYKEGWKNYIKKESPAILLSKTITNFIQNASS